MTSEISTWAKTKDYILIGFCGVIVYLALQIQTDLAALKTQVAVYQANLDALKTDHIRLAAAVDEHFKEDRARFLLLPKGARQ